MCDSEQFYCPRTTNVQTHFIDGFMLFFFLHIEFDFDISSLEAYFSRGKSLFFFFFI